ncbi:MAG: HNH endonuclease signature motif containing protein [Gemmatimonadaceae bacterium]
MSGDGLCECGCGQPAPLAGKTDRLSGRVKGEPQRFISGHGRRLSLGESYVVDPDTGCWVWQYAKTSAGYGYTRPMTSDGTRLAHRAYYEMARGPAPKGTEIHHTCGRRDCVNPAHMEAMTRREHMESDGRLARNANRKRERKAQA